MDKHTNEELFAFCNCFLYHITILSGGKSVTSEHSKCFERKGAPKIKFVGKKTQGFD